MALWFIRALFLVAVVASTFFIATSADIQDELGYGPRLTAFMTAPLLVAGALVLIDVVWRRKNLQAISGLFFGMLAGVVFAWILSSIVSFVLVLFYEPQEMERFVKILSLMNAMLTVACIYVCVSIVLQTKDDFRFIIPYVEFSKEVKGARPLLLDTSAIIDGRIADVMGTGVLDSPLVIPRFVLGELHAVADSSDSLRRNRGRRGLDILRRLQEAETTDVTVWDGRAAEVENALGVDNKLVELAGHLGARIMTTDYNLNKVAQVRGVEVVNINDIANALKTVVLPGEGLAVKVVKPGEEAGQGVGYLDDGTMVVIEKARDRIGEQVVIDITSTLQTSAGRMIFGRIQGERPGR